LVNGVFVLLQYLQRLLTFESEAVDALLELSEFFGAVVFLAVAIGALQVDSFCGGML
jgi:hypothetical protein